METEVERRGIVNVGAKNPHSRFKCDNQNLTMQHYDVRWSCQCQVDRVFRCSWGRINGACLGYSLDCQ
jgi:hypothetical protein